MINKILNNKQLFVPIIFTEKQFLIMDKMQKNNDQNKKLSNAEKKAYYTSIKKKLQALTALSEENQKIYLNNISEIIPTRIKKAELILERYTQEGKSAFISGSFLFSEKYNDIDLFIVGKKGYKEESSDGMHIIQITEKKLRDPIFQSAIKISVSNFPINTKAKAKKIKLYNLMSLYHESIIELMTRKEKKGATRDIIFNYFLSKNTIIDGKSLKANIDSASIKQIDSYYESILQKQFKKNYLYVSLHEYIKTLDNSIKNIKNNNHLKHYKSIYEDIIYGNARSKAEIN